MSKGHDNSREFAPEETEAALRAFDRRTFMKLMAASLAATGAMQLGACSEPQPLERIAPYVRTPEYTIPGLPAFYASSLPTRGFSSGYGRGVVVESHEGRPTKIEGNPRHPSSLGGTDIFMQAAVLQLYDPGRSTMCLDHGEMIAWGNLLNQLRTFIGTHGGPANVRLRLLTGSVTSPTFGTQMRQLQSLFPKLVWHVDEVPGTVNARAGQQRALGRAVTPVYDLSRTRRLISLDSHFLAEEPGSLRYAREFAHAHRLPLHDFGANVTHAPNDGGSTEHMTDASMARLYVAESTLTPTGARADHRMGISPRMIPRIAEALGRAIAGGVAMSGENLPPPVAAWVRAAAADLKLFPQQSLILVGEYQPPEVHAAALAMNVALGAVGNTVRFLEPIEISPEASDTHSLAALKDAMRSGEVDLLLMVDVNPAFCAPTDLAFAETLERFSREKGYLALHAGGYVDETAALCTHHVPLSHPLEAWGDLRGHDGTAGIVQPLIEPLWQSKSAIEILAAVNAIGLDETARGTDASVERFAGSYELVRRTWFDGWSGLTPRDRELRWRKILREGVIEDTAAKDAANFAAPDLSKFTEELTAAATQGNGDAIGLVFRPDPTLGDGFWANHPWLQELPKPFTHITWENVALLSPRTAGRLGIEESDHESRETVAGLKITVDGKTIEIPAWVQVGHPENVVTLHLGGGRTSEGDIQQGAGVNVYPLRTTEYLWHRDGAGVKVEKSGRRFEVACTQPHQFMTDRDVARVRTVDHLPPPQAPTGAPDLESTTRGADGKSVHLSLYDETRYAGYKWGAVIDLSACIGCNACVIACQAENNIPTVGKEQVRRGREMHWLRIDTYYGSAESRGAKDLASPLIHFQPMMCQHCEDAPCEVVCPVEATTHSEEGINEMTYNRCVGTRYCSNNCPYKVRRFNFYAYNKQASYGQPQDTGVLEAMQKNPNVTVRSRGVMEKCTYCIQRINRARIAAKREWAKADDPRAREPAPEMRSPVADGWLPGGKAQELPRLELQTACQQACPAEAIVFGDLNDAQAQVTRLKGQSPWAPINYGVLTELNTQPRTSYLERILNLNSALAARGGGDA